jgi:adenylate kinase
MLGAPASGKGTQAARLASHFDLPNLSTGALIRGEQQRGTELGALADRYLSGGGFLPDELIVEIMDRWLLDHGKDGFVLDGFPRTLPQAEAFDSKLSESGHSLDIAFLLEADLGSLHQRIANRVHCSVCGGTFQLVEPGVAIGSPCRQLGCGGKLAPRSDDEPETYAGRLANFHELTGPLIHYYQHAGVLKRVDGCASPDEVFNRLLEQVGVSCSIQTT